MALRVLLGLAAGATFAWSSTPSANAGSRSSASLKFSLSADVPGTLHPGAQAESIPVTLRNPTGAAIWVTSVSAGVRSTGESGCSPHWFRTTPVKTPSGGIAVPAHSSVTLPAQGASPPTIRMIESGTNQNACQEAELRLGYAGGTRGAAAGQAGASRASSSGGLPFTGLVLWLLAAGGVLLGLAGVGLRRAVRGSSAGTAPGGAARR